jgi:hypothetical protein
MSQQNNTAINAAIVSAINQPVAPQVAPLQVPPLQTAIPLSAENDVRKKDAAVSAAILSALKPPPILPEAEKKEVPKNNQRNEAAVVSAAILSALEQKEKYHILLNVVFLNNAYRDAIFQKLTETKYRISDQKDNTICILEDGIEITELFGSIDEVRINRHLFIKFLNKENDEFYFNSFVEFLKSQKVKEDTIDYTTKYTFIGIKGSILYLSEEDNTNIIRRLQKGGARDDTSAVIASSIVSAIAPKTIDSTTVMAPAAATTAVTKNYIRLPFDSIEDLFYKFDYDQQLSMVKEYFDDYANCSYIKIVNGVKNVNGKDVDVITTELELYDTNDKLLKKLTDKDVKNEIILLIYAFFSKKTLRFDLQASGDFLKVELTTKDIYYLNNNLSYPIFAFLFVGDVFKTAAGLQIKMKNNIAFQAFIGFDRKKRRSVLNNMIPLNMFPVQAFSFQPIGPNSKIVLNDTETNVSYFKWDNDKLEFYYQNRYEEINLLTYNQSHAWTLEIILQNKTINTKFPTEDNFLKFWDLLNQKKKKIQFLLKSTSSSVDKLELEGDILKHVITTKGSSDTFYNRFRSSSTTSDTIKETFNKFSDIKFDYDDINHNVVLNQNGIELKMYYNFEKTENVFNLNRLLNFIENTFSIYCNVHFKKLPLGKVYVKDEVNLLFNYVNMTDVHFVLKDCMIITDSDNSYGIIIPKEFLISYNKKDFVLDNNYWFILTENDYLHQRVIEEEEDFVFVNQKINFIQNELLDIVPTIFSFSEHSIYKSQVEILNKKTETELFKENDMCVKAVNDLLVVYTKNKTAISFYFNSTFQDVKISEETGKKIKLTFKFFIVVLTPHDKDAVLKIIDNWDKKKNLKTKTEYETLLKDVSKFISTIIDEEIKTDFYKFQDTITPKNYSEKDERFQLLKKQYNERVKSQEEKTIIDKIRNCRDSSYDEIITRIKKATIDDKNIDFAIPHYDVYDDSLSFNIECIKMIYKKDSSIVEKIKNNLVIANNYSKYKTKVRSCASIFHILHPSEIELSRILKTFRDDNFTLDPQVELEFYKDSAYQKFLDTNFKTENTFLKGLTETMQKASFQISFFDEHKYDEKRNIRNDKLIQRMHDEYIFRYGQEKIYNALFDKYKVTSQKTRSDIRKLLNKFDNDYDFKMREQQTYECIVKLKQTLNVKHEIDDDEEEEDQNEFVDTTVMGKRDKFVKVSYEFLRIGDDVVDLKDYEKKDDYEEIDEDNTIPAASKNAVAAIPLRSTYDPLLFQRDVAQKDINLFIQHAWIQVASRKDSKTLFYDKLIRYCICLFLTHDSIRSEIIMRNFFIEKDKTVLQGIQDSFWYINNKPYDVAVEVKAMANQPDIVKNLLWSITQTNDKKDIIGKFRYCYENYPYFKQFSDLIFEKTDPYNYLNDKLIV